MSVIIYGTVVTPLPGLLKSLTDFIHANGFLKRKRNHFNIFPSPDTIYIINIFLYYWDFVLANAKKILFYFIFHFYSDIHQFMLGIFQLAYVSKTTNLQQCRKRRSQKNYKVREALYNLSMYEYYMSFLFLCNKFPEYCRTFC